MKPPPQTTYKTPKKYYLTLVNGSLGMFYFGYTMGVINVTYKHLTKQFGWTEDEEAHKVALMMTVVPFGMILGGLGIGKVVQLGRRKACIITDIFAIISTILLLFNNY